ncbi:SDR family oxidoreductase [Spongiibacter sp.]|uniref:SDR family oxidoreductase n=1 Tax=Spongiibacter sp. TaxID=2024860 RepID=UPI003561C91C
MAESLHERVIVVTGASSGFGLAMSRALIEAGAKVGLIARSADKLEAACAQLGQNSFAVAADVGDSAAVDRAVAAIAQHFGAIDGLVNNAGMARPGFAEDQRDGDIAAQLQLNIAGLVYCARAAIPWLKQSANARIVNVSSASAEHHDEMAGLSLYAATKAAVERLSRDMRRELAPAGIGVTILRPGAAMTDFAAGWDFERLKIAVDAWQQCGPTMDGGMQPEHVAQSLLFCLQMPAGVSVDLLEVRPCTPVEKIRL